MSPNYDAIKLVITIALKKEIPLLWLRDNHFSPITFKSIASGNPLPSEAAQSPVLTLITRYGLDNSAQAAQWVRDVVKPDYVVNIGSCGSVTDTHGWVLPATVQNEAGDSVFLEQQLPIPWPEHEKITRSGKLLSALTPQTDPAPLLRQQVDYVDMEAFSQAQVFAESAIGFSCIKYITDRCDQMARESFDAALPVMRETIQRSYQQMLAVDQPAISVIIPTHNRAQWLTETLLSVQQQSLPPLEIIVVDDGSTDDTPAMLQTFGDAIKVITLPSSQGVSRARNLGAEAATGEWLAFLDSDDHWHPDKLAEQWAYQQQRPYLQALQCNEQWLRNGKQLKAHKKPDHWCFEPSLERCSIAPSAILLRRQLFIELGGFDEKLLACEDYDLWLRLTRHFPVGLAPIEGVIKHGGHPDQLSYRYPAMDRFRVYAMLKLLPQELSDKQRQQLETVLRKKLNILYQGAVKRQQQQTAAAYKALIDAPDLSSQPAKNSSWLLNNLV